MEKIKLALTPRTVLGKKVKQLRREGIIPANLFGKDMKSISLQIAEKDFQKILKQAGETAVIEVKVKENTYPALIHKVQKDPVSGKVIHVDFHKVNLKEKITTHIPIKLIGLSPAEKTGIGLVLQTLNELEIESLPTDIPHEIEASIEGLSEVGQTIHVKDLKVDKSKIEVMNDPEEVVISVQTAEMKEEVVEEAPSPEEVEAIAEKGEEEVGEEEKSKEEKGEGPTTEKEEPEKDSEANQ